jgi:hypothetical protein
MQRRNAMGERNGLCVDLLRARLSVFCRLVLIFPGNLIRASRVQVRLGEREMVREAVQRFYARRSNEKKLHLRTQLLTNLKGRSDTSNTVSMAPLDTIKSWAHWQWSRLAEAGVVPNSREQQMVDDICCVVADQACHAHERDARVLLPGWPAAAEATGRDATTNHGDRRARARGRAWRRAPRRNRLRRRTRTVRAVTAASRIKRARVRAQAARARPVLGKTETGKEKERTGHMRGAQSHCSALKVVVVQLTS